MKTIKQKACRVSILSLYLVQMKRGTNKKSVSKLLTVWIPDALEETLARGAAREDSDKSKFVR
ncbi:MAG TPA: hypothetical protein VNN22_24275, partial [Verrucomicrobiae bacterium]|nr:hypothetical protein [Verrucomicrobiae bacterium]